MPADAPIPSRPLATRRRQAGVTAAIAVIPLLGLLAACGGATSTTSTSGNTAPATPAPTGGSDSGTQGRARANPGVSGLIAAVSHGTLQVQSATAQNTVLYTAATRFTRVASGHVAAGDCVTVTGTPAAGSAQGLTATSARIEAKVDGACPTAGAGGGFPGGGFPGGGSPGGGFARGGGPTGARSGTPPTGPAGAGREFASATGTVSSVTRSTILLKGILRQGRGAAGSTATPAPATVVVTLGPSATVTRTVAATSAAAVVGQCARATGPATSTGTIKARSITVSPPGATGCRQGFGGNGNGAGRAQGAGSNA
jgi:hypothetical protein